MDTSPLKNLIVVVRGAGDMASGVAWRLHMARFNVIMTEIAQPLAVRRAVSFCEAVYDGVAVVEGVEAVRIELPREAQWVWAEEKIPVVVDPDLKGALDLSPQVLVEAAMAKRNLGTTLHDAPLIVALGPGYKAGRDVHFVVETNRGHNLGRVITEGEAEPNTGVPGAVAGLTGCSGLRPTACSTPWWPWGSRWREARFSARWEERRSLPRPAGCSGDSSGRA